MSDQPPRSIDVTLFSLLEDVLQLAEGSQALLLNGEPVDPTPWFVLADRIGRLSPVTGQPQELLSFVVQLATVLREGDETAAEDLAEALQAPAQGDFLVHLGRAIAARRRIDTSAEKSPRAWEHFGHELYSLAPAVGPPAVHKAVHAYRKAAEAYLRQHEPSAALAPTGSYVGLANTLAQYEGDLEWLHQALSLGVEVNRELPEETSSLNALVLLSNLINTTTQLAVGEPARAREHATIGLDFATRLEQLLVGASVPDDAAVLRQIAERALRAQVAFHVQLMAAPSDEHALAASAAASRLESLATVNDKSDLRLHVADARRRITSRVAELTGRINADAEHELDGEPDGLVARIRTETDRLESVAESILAMATDDERQLSIDNVLDAEYQVLTDAIVRVALEVGLNHHVCRLLLGLGACSAMRLGAMSVGVITRWVVSTGESAVSSRGGSTASLRQERPAVHDDAAETTSIAGVCGLAAFAAAFEVPSAPSRYVGDALGRRNGQLVETLLAAVPVDRPTTPSQTATDDLCACLRVLPYAARQEFVAAYGLTIELPAPDDEQVIEEASDAPAADDDAELSDAAEKPASSGRALLPELEFDWEDQPASGVDGPEGLVGRHLRHNGERYVVEQILGRGNEKIVLGLKNLSGGEDFALAIFVGDRLSSLKKTLSENIQELLKTDPNRLVGLCDEILALSPGNEVALFDKGMGLIALDRYADALACFESASASSPTDVLNRLHQSWMLAKLSRHTEAAVEVVKATRIDADEVRHWLRELPPMREELQHSLRQTIAAAPASSEMQILLDTLRI